MSYHSWTNKPPTKEYQDAHPGEFSKWAEKYCKDCGRLPAFCECLDPIKCRKCDNVLTFSGIAVGVKPEALEVFESQLKNWRENGRTCPSCLDTRGWVKCKAHATKGKLG